MRKRPGAVGGALRLRLEDRKLKGERLKEKGEFG